VNAGRTPLFCDTALAQRIERAEAQLIAMASRAASARQDTAGFVIPLCGGVASFAEEGSPFNKVAGLGFDGVPNAAALAERSSVRSQRDCCCCWLKVVPHGLLTNVGLAARGDRREKDLPDLRQLLVSIARTG
jgi:hypothetical protein